MSYGNLLDDPAPKVTNAYYVFLESGRTNSSVTAIIFRNLSQLSTIEEPVSMHEVDLSVKQMILCRHCDSFQTYLSDLLLIIYNNYPNSFYKKQFEVRRIFEFDDLDDIRRTVIEEEVGSLTYKSIVDLNDHVKKSTGFQLFKTQFCVLKIFKLMNLRNVITHNRGVVNSIYLARDKSLKDQLGTLVLVPSINRVDEYLGILAQDIDRRACDHFNFPASDTMTRSDNA